VSYTNLPLNFTGDTTETEMFKMFSPDQIEALKSGNYTYNHHHMGVDPSEFETDKGLKETFVPTSTSVDPKGEHFVASVEGKTYPFYGTQFHPEKQYLSFAPDFNFDHSELSEHINRNFADFYVGQTRKNDNTFPSYE
jgi:gamma-glutamyl hydrolase